MSYDDDWEHRPLIAIRKLAFAQINRINSLFADEVRPSGAVLALEATLAHWLDDDDEYYRDKKELDEHFGVGVDGASFTKDSDERRYWYHLYRLILISAIEAGPFKEGVGVEYVVRNSPLDEVEAQLEDAE